MALAAWPSAAVTPTGADPAAANTGTTVTATPVAAPVAAPSAKTVTLPTGDRIVVRTAAGHTSYQVAGESASHRSSFTSFQTGSGDRYLIPAEATPYLGRQLDASMFDVTALLDADLTSRSRIPVTLRFAAGATPAAPPGVTLTSTSASSATGYLTAASGADFAAGLRASIGADVRAGRRPGTGALFGGVTSIGLDGIGGGDGVVQPHYPLHILQMNAVDLTGAPTDALAVVINTDALDRQFPVFPIVSGIGRLAVPAGHYAAYTSFTDFDDRGNVTAVRIVSLMDFTVAATGTTTVTLDERTATARPTVTTPRPATEDNITLGLWRKDAIGQLATFGYFGTDATPYYLNPQPASAVGSFRYRMQWGGAGTSTTRPYRYDVAFASDSIPADQAYTVRRDQIATVRQNFYADPAATSDGSLLSAVMDDFALANSWSMGASHPAGVPLTQYLGTADGDVWKQDFVTAAGIDYGADLHSFKAGHSYQLDWAHGPHAPSSGVHNGPTGHYLCLACASQGALSVGLSIGGDSEPDHLSATLDNGVISPPPNDNSDASAHFTLYQDGAVVYDADKANGKELTGLPDAPITFRLVYDTDLSAMPGISQSTATHTDLTFVDRPGADPTSTAPGWEPCDFVGLVKPPCQVQPVISLNYHLATDHTNTSPVGPQVLSLDVSHLSYGGFGSHARITSTSVSVSFDGGKTWKPTAIRGSHGHYAALWLNPRSAAGTSPDLRVTATDAIGGSITQTVSHAYTIASAAAH
ncbi:hypothetical protein [Streptomyces sp. NPDC091217]|uniref:hypothetical protein n=1 Tax=Streptomyces sp. NPDC091217 TaxID=3365975 RepID=UPI00381F1AD4